MLDKKEGSGWFYFLLVIVGIVIATLFFSLTKEVCPSKEEIAGFEDKACQRAYQLGYEECQNNNIK
jgi:hypothetical protein